MMRLHEYTLVPLCVVLSMAMVIGLAMAAEEESVPVNLLANGNLNDVDEATALPRDWTTKHPKNVRPIKAAGREGLCIEMTGDEGLMGTYGTDLFSAPIKIKPNVRYRVSGWARSAGPKQILFVKGFASVTRRVDGVEKTEDEIVYQMKKEIETSKDWRAFSMEFDVRPAKVFSDFQHEVKYVRVLLWAYWPAGTGWYDDIAFVELGPIEGEERRHDAAMTHTGEAPRLLPGGGDGAGEGAVKDADDKANAAVVDAPPVDVQELWINASNAWRDGDHRTAAEAAGKIIVAQPQHINARLLAARAMVKLDRVAEATAMLDWLEEAWAKREKEGAVKIDPWQHDFTLLARGESLLRQGRDEDGRAMLTALREATDSEHVRHGVDALLGAGSGTESDAASESGAKSESGK